MALERRAAFGRGPWNDMSKGREWAVHEASHGWSPGVDGKAGRNQAD